MNSSFRFVLTGLSQWVRWNKQFAQNFEQVWMDCKQSEWCFFSRFANNLWEYIQFGLENTMSLLLANVLVAWRDVPKIAQTFENNFNTDKI